jgi:hypothetical protein
MEPDKNLTSRLFITLGVFMFLLMISVVVPAKWLGVKPRTYTPLNFDDIQAYQDLSKDKNFNSSPDWKDLLENTVSTTNAAALESTPDDAKVEELLNDPDNLTSSYSKNMLIASSYLEQNGKTDEASKQQIAEALIQQEKDKIITKTYTSKDLVVQKTESETMRKNYGNALGTLLKEAGTYKIGEGDLEILQTYLDTKDASVLDSLRIKEDNVAVLIRKMTVMPVPLSATPYHLLALNRLSAYLTLLDGLSKADTDPIRASIVFKEYASIIKAMFGALVNIKEYFKVESVVFTSKESGYVFMQEYTTQK